MTTIAQRQASVGSIVHIAAMDPNTLIGVNGDLPWNCPEDLKLFKAKTINNIVVMGSTTYATVAKLLKNRKVYRLTHKPIDTMDITLDGIISLRKLYPDKTIFIAGGAATYERTLHITDKIELTIMDEEVAVDPGDVLTRYPFKKMLKLFELKTVLSYYTYGAYSHELFKIHRYVRKDTLHGCK